ncbi:MAG: Hpt domain-containing protein, partial [Dehalococcoidia bacterium]
REEGESDVVRRAAHTLKSNAANFGALHLSELCKELEAKGKAGDLEGAAEQIEQIRIEYTSARNALEAVRAGL